MAKTIELVHWPDAPDVWTPYAPAIRIKGGTMLCMAGVTAAPVYHHHPHRPEEFDALTPDMYEQTRAALENLRRGLAAAGGKMSDIVFTTRYLTDMTDQDGMSRACKEYFGDHQPCSTTVQVVRLATDPRCLIEMNAIAIVDE